MTANPEEKLDEPIPDEEIEHKEEQQPITEEIRPQVNDYDKVLQSIFDRTSQPLESVTVSLEVVGVYSLPESWKTRVPEEDTNRYLVTFGEMKVEGGKIRPKQLTEEEKKALEEAQAKGKKPAKPEKKKPEDEAAELKAKEEQEALLLEQRLKQENERKLMDPQTLFYTEKEDPFMEPSIVFETANENEETVANIQSQEFKEEILVNFEEMINQKNGCWIYFDRLPALEEDDAKKKAKPPAKKGATEVDNKPIHGKAWLAFDQLIAPGGIELDQRVNLATVVEEPIKEEPVEEKKEVKKEAKKETKKEVKEEPNPEDLTLFETAKTYVHVKISLSQAINPVHDENAPSCPSDVLSKTPAILKAPNTEDAAKMYRFQLEKNVKEMAKDYNVMGSARNNSEEEKAREQQMTQKQKEKLIQRKRREFMEEINRTGKYNALKEELKKTVARIAYEKFKKVSGNSMTKDQFYSELYVYLIEQMHTTVDLVTKLKASELPEDIVMAKEFALKKKEDSMAKVFQETDSDRLERLYKEYERTGNFDLAENYILDIINLDPNNKHSWMRYYKFAMKIDNIAKAEECLKKALELDSENTEYLLAMTGILVYRKRYKEAENCLKKILRKDFTYIPSNILIAIVYELTGHNGLFKKHIEIAKRKKMRDLNLLPPKGSLRFDAPLPDPSRQLSNEEIDSLYYGLAEFLLKGKQSHVAEKVMSYIQDKDSLKYHMNMARCYFIRGSYNECLDELEKLLEKDSKNQRALKYKGHALFLQGNLFDSEEAYVSAIRIKPKPKSLTLYERLGELYLKRKSWTDAQVVFYKCCAEPNRNSSVSWEKLGVSYLKLNNLVEAEDALTQASILDNNNADIWGYKVLLCLMANERDVQAEQMLVEAFRLGLRNVGLLDSIGDCYFNKGDHEKASQCFKRAVDISPEDGELLLKLANCYANIEGFSKDALECYERAFDYREGTNNKIEVAHIINNFIENNPEVAEDNIEILEKIKPFIE